MPIRPPVKAVLRKDLLLGGGAGALLCAVIAGAVLALGPLLGVDWGGSPDGANGRSAAVDLPTIPATSPQAADALRQRAQAPSVIARRNQPTTSPAGGRGTAPAATPSRPAPSVSTRTRQPTVAPRIVTPPSTQDAPVVPAPEAPASTSPAALAAAAIPATPVTPAKTAKALKLRVASVAVETDDNDLPELRLSMGVEGAVAGAATPDKVTVRLRPKLPDDKHAAAGPLALRAHVDVVDAPADDGGPGSSLSAGPGSVQVPGLQMRVRMALEPVADTTADSAPTVADAGDGDGQSNVIALSVPLAAFSGEDTPAPTPAPTDPSPAPAPAQPTEIRLDLAPANDSSTHPETDTANVPAPPDTPTSDGHDSADVPVTVVVDSTPQPPADPAPAPPADPAPAPQPADPAPADPAPADPAPADPAPADPTPPADRTPPAYPAGDSSGSSAATATATATTPAGATAPAADATATTAAPGATTDATVTAAPGS